MTVESDRASIRVPIRCPHCGKVGRVPTEILSKAMRCKQCGRKFYVQPEGVSTNRPNNILVAKDPVVGTVSTDEMSFERFVDRWNSLRPVYRALVWIVLASLLVGALVIVPLLPRRLPDLPPTLTGRAEYFADALFRNDVAAAANLASARTDKDLCKWFGSVRPSDWPRVVSPEVVSDIDVNVLAQDEQRGRSVTTITIWIAKSLLMRAAPLPATKSGNAAPMDGMGDKEKLTFVVNWVLDDQGFWRINGQEMLASDLRESRLHGL